MEADRWNERYAGKKRLFSESPDETLVELVTGLPPGRAADLGAGEGRNSLWLAQRGWKVTAVDVSQVALERAAAAAGAEGLALDIEVADAVEFLGRGERFDLVVIANMHPEPGERAELFARAGEALAPGGHLFVVGHHVSSLGKAGPPQAERLFTEKMLETGLPGLTVLNSGRRDSRHGDRDQPVTDAFVWAVRPAETAGER